MVLEFLMDIAVTILVFMSIAFMIVVMYLLKDNPDKKLVEENRKLSEQLQTLRELMKAKEAQYEAELNSVTKASKMLRELNKAVRDGAVRLVCPAHAKDATILSDGTILCEEGHRLWPKEEEVSEHG